MGVTELKLSRTYPDQNTLEIYKVTPQSGVVEDVGVNSALQTADI